jgi:hypothetical protein
MPSPSISMMLPSQELGPQEKTSARIGIRTSSAAPATEQARATVTIESDIGKSALDDFIGPSPSGFSGSWGVTPAHPVARGVNAIIKRCAWISSSRDPLIPESLC